MRTISCTNNDGVGIVFENDFSPWLLTDVDGVYLIDANLYTSDNTMTDGATYQGTTIEKRNIVLTLLDKGTDHKADRTFLYQVFKPKAPGTLVYEEDGDEKSIDYYVENVSIEGLGKHRSATVSLICPDPFFTDTIDTEVIIAGWQKLWTFPHEFTLESFGERTKTKIGTVNNESAADNIGLTITITATGAVTNPSITRVESQQTMKIGTSSSPFTMASGDVLRITTGVNDKHVYYTANGGTEEEINQYLDESSEFIQIMRGINSIGYTADSGDDYMDVLMTFRYKYLGV